jgi:hypothetical protein
MREELEPRITRKREWEQVTIKSKDSKAGLVMVLALNSSVAMGSFKPFV